jgi:Protein of unknown function (DUF2752)
VANQKKELQCVLLTLWGAVPIVLWLLPANHFDTGMVICPSRFLFERDCPFCGLTRATQYAMHFEFAKAFALNKLIVIALPICAIMYFHVMALISGKGFFSALRALLNSGSRGDRKI